MEEKLKHLVEMERDEEANKFLVKFSLALFDFLEDVEKCVVKARGDESAEFELNYLAIVGELYSSSFAFWDISFL